MSVLLAISIAALVALTWASTAIVMHIRRATRPGPVGEPGHPGRADDVAE